MLDFLDYRNINILHFFFFRIKNNSNNQQQLHNQQKIYKCQVHPILHHRAAQIRTVILKNKLELLNRYKIIFTIIWQKVPFEVATKFEEFLLGTNFREFCKKSAKISSLAVLFSFSRFQQYLNKNGDVCLKNGREIGEG